MQAIGIRREPIHQDLKKVWCAYKVDGIIAYRWYTPTRSSPARLARLLKCGVFDLYRCSRYVVIQRKAG